MAKFQAGKNVRSTKWITPVTEKELVCRTRAAARVTFWDADIASLRFGAAALAAVMLLLLLQKVGAAALLPALLVSAAGVLLISRWRGRLNFRHIYNEELIKHPDQWKNYYDILHIKPNADVAAVSTGFTRMEHLFKEVLSPETKEIGGASFTDVTEAFGVLRDRTSRLAYDRVFWLRTNAAAAPVGDPGTREISAEMQSVAEVMNDGLVGEATRRRQLPPWVAASGQVALAVVLGVLPVLVGGTSLAFAKPESTLAVPFRGLAAAAVKVSAGSIEFVVDLRSIAANQERGVIATAFQSMRLDANLVTITPLPRSTNDMAEFPSPLHPLFPEYVETRFSQFRYNVDQYGVVEVDPSWATTNAILDNLNDLLKHLERNSD